MSDDPTEGMSDEQVAGVIDLLQARIDAMTTDDVLRFIQEHQGRIACHRCGETPPGDSEHWRVCEKHPARIELAKLEAENERLRAGYAPAPAERPAPDPAHVACDKALDKALDDHDAALGEIERLKAALAAAERPPSTHLPSRKRWHVSELGSDEHLAAIAERAAAERPADVEKVRECARIFGQVDGPDAEVLCDEVERLRLAAAERPQDAPRSDEQCACPFGTVTDGKIDAEERARSYHVWRYLAHGLAQHLIAILGVDVVKRTHGTGKGTERNAWLDEMVSGAEPYANTPWCMPPAAAERPAPRVREHIETRIRELEGTAYPFVGLPQLREWAVALAAAERPQDAPRSAAQERWDRAVASALDSDAPMSEPAAGGDTPASTFERYPGLSRTGLAGALASISGMMRDCTGLLVPDDPRTYADQIRRFIDGLQGEIEALRSRPAAGERGEVERDVCRSCGADPSFDPPSGQELPIIKGALDAQADAEREAYRARCEAERLRADLAAAEDRAVFAETIVGRDAIQRSLAALNGSDSEQEAKREPWGRAVLHKVYELMRADESYHESIYGLVMRLVNRAVNEVQSAALQPKGSDSNGG